MDRRREVQHGGLAARPDGRGEELSGDGEQYVWLTPHPRDLIQPEGEREDLKLPSTKITLSS